MSEGPQNALPIGWADAEFGDVCSIRNGYAFKSKDFTAFGVPLIKQGNLTGSEVDLSNCAYLPESYLEEHSRYQVQRGDILLGMSGSIGEPSEYRHDAPALQNQRTGLLLPNAAVDLAFVRFFLEYSQAQLLDRSKGMAIQNVSAKDIQSMPLGLPPLNEQQRIVEKIETLFARLDEGEEAVREVQKLLTRYRRSVLKSAVTGQLTADWRAQREGQLEHGRDLLARILDERREKWSGRGKYKEPAEPDASGQMVLPEGWAWASIEQLGFIQSGQTPKGVGDHVVESGAVPWFKVSSMNDQGNEEAMYTSQWMFTEDSAKAAKLNVMPEGTIAFPKRGGAILTNKKRRLGVPGALDLNTMGFVPVALANYVWTYFLGLDLRRIYDGSNVPQINYHDIADLFIAVPSEEEANMISEEVEQRLVQIAKLEEWCETELKRSASLRQSILKDAFAGKLVPQDPDDEPASALLARIAAEKPTAKKTRRKTPV